MLRPRTNIVVTMAGNGERFRRAGYTLPKFKLEVRGKTLFHWAMLSLADWWDDDTEAVFAARPEHEPDGFIAREAEALGISRYRVLHLETPTDGQATTALLAAGELGEVHGPMLVYNIDTYVEAGAMRRAQAQGDGWVPCFAGQGDAWSFARQDEAGRVVELAEKRRISPHATVGLYWFAGVGLYRDCYRAHFANGGTANGERYIAPMYNTLIARGGRVEMSLVPTAAVHPLGTPEEVEAFR